MNDDIMAVHIDTMLLSQMLKTCYNIEHCRVSLLCVSENITYLADNGSRWVLRVVHKGYSSAEALQAELEWMCRISDYTAVKVPVPIQGIDGRLIQYLTVAGAVLPCVLFPYIDGPTLENVSPTAWPRWYEALGHMTALMHRYAMVAENQPPGLYKWDLDTMVGAGSRFGDWHDCPSLDKAQNELLESCVTKIKDKLGYFGTSKTTYGVIHGDVRASNIIIHEEEAFLLDFNDMGYCWYLSDFAASFSFIEHKSCTPELMVHWLTGYEAIRRLRPEEFDMLDTFIMIRRLMLLGWQNTHPQSQPVAAGICDTSFGDETVNLAKRYLNEDLFLPLLRTRVKVK